MGKLGAILRLTRFEHSILLIVAVIAAQLISGGLPQPGILLLSMITPVFVSAGAFAINDYFDIAVDRANKKLRPLVSGDITPGGALRITGACMAIGIASSLLINQYCAVIAIIFAALSILYSYRLKDLPLIGNAYVAFSMAIPFIFGNYVVSNTANYAILVIFALIFISGTAREIDGAIRDYAGDSRMRNARTLPRVIGIRASAYFAFALYIIAIAISIYIFLSVPPFRSNLVYLSMIAVSDMLLFYSGAVFALRMKKSYDLVRNISLGGMGLALVCMLISALVNIQIPF